MPSVDWVHLGSHLGTGSALICSDSLSSLLLRIGQHASECFAGSFL